MALNSRSSAGEIAPLRRANVNNPSSTTPRAAAVAASAGPGAGSVFNHPLPRDAEDTLVIGNGVVLPSCGFAVFAVNQVGLAPATVAVTGSSLSEPASNTRLVPVRMLPIDAGVMLTPAPGGVRAWLD